MVVKRLQQRVLQSGMLGSWSLHVLREARLVGIPARRTPAAANEPTGVRLRQHFDPNNPVHLARKHRCIVDDDG